MRDYMAPMEGVTNFVYRRAYHHFYHTMDKYFTPFISAKPKKKLSFQETCEVSPEKNQGMYVVPQILTCNAQDFIHTAQLLKEEYGYNEVNLNLGCPSGTVTAKGKGAGFLAEPKKLDEFLNEIFSGLDMKISIKTRIGTHYEEDWEYLLEIYKKYPIEELIIHPRIQTDMYRGLPRLNAYARAAEELDMPLCYNGNLFSVEDYKRISSRFPGTDCFMYGRGLITNPGLVNAIREGRQPGKDTLHQFHGCLYEEYQQLLSGERNVLFRMKELWSYMAAGFTNYEKYAKKIKKSQHLSEYEAAVSSLFAQQELVWNIEEPNV